MEEEEEKIDSNVKSMSQEINSRPSILLISSINDNTYIHTNVNTKATQESIDWYDNNLNEHIENNDSNIYDINKETKQLNIEEIKDMIKETVVPVYHTNNQNINYSEVSSNSGLLQIEESFSDNSDTIGLIKREKGQKLTKEQAQYIKHYIEVSTSAKSEICYKF